MHTTNNQRCPDTYFHHGIHLQCEGHRGHTSAHWNGEVWWSNDEGFPDHMPGEQNQIEHKFWFALAAVGAVLFVAVIIYFIRS
jgi:hypothetical protein